MSDRKQLYKQLVEAGVHFGHQTSRWNPSMKPYIWGSKNKIHLIDVSKTANQLQKAAKFLEGIAAEGKQILWVGTKKPAQSSIKEVATRLDMPYVNHRWVGGTLSNFTQVKKSVTRLLHDEDIIEKSEKFPHYTKKELNVIKKRADRTAKVVGGIRKFTWPVGAIVLIDVGKECSALREASVMGVPVVGVVDTNCDPSLVDYVIPANDDAERSIAMITAFLGDAVERGRESAKQSILDKRKQEAAKKAETKDAATKKVAPSLEAVVAPVELDVLERLSEEAEEEDTEEQSFVKKSAKSSAPKVAIEEDELEIDEEPTEKKAAVKPAAKRDEKSKANK